MTQADPSSRPSAEQALQQWRRIRPRIYALQRYWRLRDSKEPLFLVPVIDLFYALRSIPRIFTLLGRMLRPNIA